jgi:molecular chaperone GrpE
MKMTNNKKEVVENESEEKDNLSAANKNSEGEVSEEMAVNSESMGENEAISKLEAYLAESNEKFLRLYSDFDNYKKRMNKERIELSKTASSEIISSLLPVIDDFDRALKIVSSEKDSNPAFTEGIQLIYSKLKSILQNKGLLEIENAAGKVFDTDLHDAITIIPAPSEDLKGKVIEEVEKGYMLNGKILRHSKVVVGNIE